MIGDKTYFMSTDTVSLMVAISSIGHEGSNLLNKYNIRIYECL